MRRRLTRVHLQQLVCCLHAAILWRFLLLGVAAPMDESACYAMQRNLDDVAESIQQRRRARVLASVSQL